MTRTARTYPSDINQTSITSADLVLGTDGGGTQYIHSQSFLLTTAFPLASISWNVSSILGTPTGVVTARIVTDSGGSPSSILTNKNAIATFTPSVGWNVVPFTPFVLPAGTYWIKLTCDVQGLSTYWVLNRAGNVYADGQLKYSTNAGSTWNTYSGNDWAFKVTQGISARTTAGARSTASARNVVN